MILKTPTVATLFKAASHPIEGMLGVSDSQKVSPVSTLSFLFL